MTPNDAVQNLESASGLILGRSTEELKEYTTLLPNTKRIHT